MDASPDTTNRMGKTSKQAVVALIFAFLSLIGIYWMIIYVHIFDPISFTSLLIYVMTVFPIGALAFIYGVISLTKRPDKKSTVMALAGLVSGGIIIAVLLYLLLVWLAVGFAFFKA
jgi:hypothetical protein